MIDEKSRRAGSARSRLGKSDSALRQALQSQYLASLAMLKEAVSKCSEASWDDPRDKDRTWHTAYHAVWYAHRYLLPTSKDHVRWKGHGRDNDGACISRKDLLEYIRFVVRQVPDLILHADFRAGSGFSWYPVGRLEMHLINIRHIQQHAGELYERLGTRQGTKLRWAGHARRRSRQ
jgi:hypothetical protein